MCLLYRYGILFVLAALGFCAALFVFVHQETAPYIYDSPAAVPHAQAALVLGASIIGTSTLSHVLKERADLALLLYQRQIVSKIIITGDNGALSHNEVDPVGKYLLVRGIPKEDLFLDHAGFDTYSSLYRARDVFRATSLIVVSQSFHLPRAVFIGRQLGLSVFGLAVPGNEAYVFNQVREVPATIKAVLDLFTFRLPKYLGPQIPVWGSAAETWPQSVVY